MKVLKNGEKNAGGLNNNAEILAAFLFMFVYSVQ